MTIENLKVLVSGHDAELLTSMCHDIIEQIPDIRSAATPNPDGWAAHKIIERFGIGEIVHDDYEPGESIPGQTD